MDMKRVEEIKNYWNDSGKLEEHQFQSLVRTIKVQQEEINSLAQTIKQQQEQLEQHKKALNFYADPKTYEVNVTDQWEPRTPIDEDAGNKARKSLEES